MRLHRLSITAFGPYPGQETIDFEPLNEAGLFLLTGPTGAGKSTVFDAVCFALYGATSSPENSKGLKSAFAADSARPGIELELTVGTERYLVARIPAWRRPSRRARSGWVSEEAQVSLSRRGSDGAWEVVATRNDEAGRHLQERIGLNREQFVQVVMLPQGRFAQFLTASSSEREAILKKLFPTSVYGTVQDVLRERAQRAGEVLALREDGTRRAEEALEDAMRRHALPVPDPGPLGQRYAAARRRTEEAVGASSQTRGERSAAASAARRGAEDARRAVAEWREHRLLAERREASARSAGRRRRDRESLEAAEAAEPLLAASARAAKSREEAAARREELAAEVERASALRRGRPAVRVPEPEEARREEAFWAPGDDAAETAPRDGSAYLEDLDARARQLEEAARLHREHDQLEAATGRIERELAEAERAAERARAHQESTAAARAEALEAGEELARRVEAGEQVPAREAEAREALAATRALAEQLERVRELRVEADRAERRRRDRSAEHEGLLALRFERAASTLAERLEPGSPCPVCGGTDHPHPAAAAEGGEVTEANLDASARRRDEAEEGSRTALARHAEAVSRAESLRQAGAEEDAERAEQRAEQARRALEEHERARSERTRRARELTELDAALDRAREELRTAELAAGGARARLEQSRERSATLRQSLQGLPGAEQVAEKERALAGLARSAHRALLLRDRIEGLERRIGEESAELEELIRGSRFDDVEAARGAALPEEEREALRRRIRRDDEEEARVDEAWNAPAHRRLLARIEEGEEEPDPGSLESLEERAAAAEAALEEAVAELARQEGLRDWLAAREEEAGVEGERIAELRRRAGTLRDLADVAAGSGSENRLKMSLTTYVLAAQLEEIAEAASVRLRQMTSGRYTVRHSDAAARHGARSGLGLEVFDAWTSEARPASTLSGGETFMTSLCLALGTADVVQGRAGGIDIDTLFVDEGFGTLDDATLEQVMDALEALREHGRVIGVVSHVADMRSRVPHQVRIDRSPSGSSIEVSES
ncbi:AAA family ATPase [Rothia halotolerans]|uniref:AAA family ATPase n=1 Tax=Rothia halotolerans TaxID=405770 RepID=UPI0013EB0185|nr:AAA family ATPase [Rothia halotolerans]